ncbi:MAG TPA: rhodanese-like domain-containing protein [Gemmatimonadales bacterium]|nr:rhodanese-like domain-containing protein [Gemmatimonadales bacterium]
MDERNPDMEEGQTLRVRFRRNRRKPRWLIALVVFVLPVLVGLGVMLLAGPPIAFEVVRRLATRRFPDVHWIDTKGLAAWLTDTKRVRPVLLDARTRDEYAVSHLPGALRMDPYRPLLRPLRGMSKDTAIVVYSTVGYRGARLVHWLTAQGYNNATALSGSIFAWANEGRPLEREGRPVAQVHPYDDSWKYLLSSDYRIEVPPVEKKSAAP